MSKAAEAFRTISEVADDLGIQKHVLRFWEVKFNQIRPMKRGGGRRYYRPEDMELLRGIRQLLHRDGYTIKGVQKILREQGVDAVKVPLDSDPADTAAATPTGPPENAPPVQAKGKASRARSKTASASQDDASVGPEQSKVILAAITELAACRAILAGAKAEKRPEATKPTSRARRSA